MLFSISQLASLLGCPAPAAEAAIANIATDARRVQPGGLFIARKGGALDGHAFLEQAKANGAVAAVVTEHQPKSNLPQLVVQNADEALEAIARAARARFTGKVIGVTGSCGKTTVKDFLKAALHAHGPISSYNNHIGLCETLANLPQNDAFCVLEIGTNATGEIAQLGDIAQPDVAMVTIVQPVHGAGIGSVADIQREKLSLFNTLPDNAPVIVPQSLVQGLTEQHGGRFSNVYVFDKITEVPSIQFPTPARVYNAKAALTVRNVLGVDKATFNQRLAEVPVGAGRGQVHTVALTGQEAAAPVTIIDDSYNANPASMQNALEVLRNHPLPEGAKRIAVLGQMNELGADEVRYHTELAAECAGVDAIHGVGPLMQHTLQALPENQQSQWAETVADFSPEAFAATLNPGDVVCVKGSKGIFWVHQFVPRLLKALQS